MQFYACALFIHYIEYEIYTVSVFICIIILYSSYFDAYALLIQYIEYDIYIIFYMQCLVT